jgi:hypothetical protein
VAHVEPGGRRQGEHLVDRAVQGGFNRSSQH